MKKLRLRSENRVLPSDFQPSSNFFLSDLILRDFLQKFVSKQGQTYMQPRWAKLGAEAATEMDALSLLADKHGPELVKRDFYGETINEIRFHPAYNNLMDKAVTSEMFRVKWEPTLRQQFNGDLHKLGFTSFFLYTMGEGGIPCPLCMTDGVARLLDRYADEADQIRLLPHIYTDQLEELYTGAMFLTEKAGGSDVGANLVRAEQLEGNLYRLNGEKWFCSNANAELIFALARTNEDVPGTRGLSIFLVEKYLPDGSRNPMDFIRLKDKLGVRSMASAEIVLTDTLGKRVGEEGQGFKIMADMVNLSRIYNATASIAFMRRALIEAYQFVGSRITFGKKLIEHALVRTKLQELGSLYLANFYLSWHAIRVLDRADNGDLQAQHLIRLLTPMVKKETAETGVYLVRECMELMGGIGYIEDGVMPKLMRDMMVLPIWEGAGNIMLLDMLRALTKSDGLAVMLEEVQKQLKGTVYQGLLDELLALLAELPKLERPDQEATAKPLFERLTKLYMISLLQQYRDEESRFWIDPALDYWTNQLINPGMKVIKAANREEIEALMAWEVSRVE